MRSRPSANFKSFHPGDEGVGFGDQHLGQAFGGTFARKFGQWIVDVVRLTKKAMTLVSLDMAYRSFPGGSGRLGHPPRYAAFNQSSSPRLPA